MNLPAWTDDYPDPAVVRHEVEAMIDAVTTGLIDAFGDALQGLWLKGSTVKPWDGPLDYVPEVSDIDFHFRVTDLAGSHMATVDAALALHEDIERRFRAAVPSPIHIPRLQFLPIEHVESIPGFVASPVNAVRTLHGPVLDGPSDLDASSNVRTEATRLVEAGDTSVLAGTSLGLLENPGYHLFRALRALTWLVSPVGGRVACVRGCDYEWTWSANRTAIVKRLVELGDEEIVEQMIAYYTSGWRFFLSHWQDSDAGRQTFRSALRLLQLGADVGRAAL